MIRGILGVILAVVFGSIIILLIQMLGHRCYPSPPGMDLKDPKALKSYVQSLPFCAFLFVLAAYAAGSFTAGASGAWIGREPWAGWAAGAVLMAMGLVNLLKIPHPRWFWVASLAIYLPAAWAGADVVGRAVHS